MSDEYRSDREQDARGGYGGRAREASGRDRWSERNGYGPGGRSFDDGGRGGGWSPRSEGYGGQGYGRQDYGGAQAYGAQGYAGGTTGGHGWRGSSYERGMGGDYGRGYGYQRERGASSGGGFGGQTADPYTQSVADGDFGGWRKNIGEGGEHRGRGPKGYQRSDERIREDVSDRLSDDSWLDASQIEVAVKDCEVTLSGTVPDREAKRRAEDLAEQVSGVKHVQVNLRVQPQGRNAPEAGARASGGGDGIGAQGRTAGSA